MTVATVVRPAPISGYFGLIMWQPDVKTLQATDKLSRTEARSVNIRQQIRIFNTLELHP
jgi:hypothetical protein